MRSSQEPERMNETKRNEDYVTFNDDDADDVRAVEKWQNKT